MNINLVAVPLSAKGRLEFETRFTSSVDYGREIFGESSDHTILAPEYGIFNAGRLDGTWSVPTWYEGDQVIAVSQPPIPVREVVTSESYESVLRQIVRHHQFQDLLPNHFGISKSSSDEIVVWNDTNGLGRSYYVQNENFFAACNHLGTLAFFLEGEVTLDEVAVGKYAGASFFMDVDSPFTGIKRIDAGQKIIISRDGSVSHEQFSDASSLVSPTGEIPNYALVADEMQRIAKNLDNLSVRTPTVYLSGGRDARMTAGLWLSGGSDARVVTLGTLEREAELAQELMSRVTLRDGQNVEHEIRVSKGSDITQSLQERVELAFKMWDGDAAATNIKRNLSVPSGRAALSIGGVGGEIMHGYYYSRPGALERVRDESNPFSNVLESFGARYLTEEAAQGIQESFSNFFEKTKRLNLDNFSALDYLYMDQKFRRWGNQALNSTSAIMLASPAFVRACFNLQPEEKVAKAFPVHLVETAIPEWSGVEYYKANPTDQKRLMKKGLATFQSDPDGFTDLMSKGRRWAKYLKEESVDGFLKAAERDEATYAHESWLNIAIWLESLETHAANLNERVSLALKNSSPATEIEISSLNSAEVNVDTCFLESILRDWPFKHSNNDSNDAKLLRDNELRLGNEVVPLDSEHWVELFSEENTQFLVFQSLRWIDPLIRNEEMRHENDRQWVALFDRWWSFISNEESLNRIWNPTTLVQRATALALGRHLFEQLPAALVETHMQALRKELAQSIDASLCQKAVAALVLIYDAHRPEELKEPALWREINAALDMVIRAGGGLFADNADEMLAAKDSWSTFLNAIDPQLEFTTELFQRIRETEFWVQTHQPDGSVVPFGSKAASDPVLDSLPSLRYVRSHATEGQPPTNVRFVDPNGLVTGRTGWGETERNLVEETFWSIVAGPIRSRKEHQDAGRITFSSQGVNWLVDPYDAELSSAKNHSGVFVEDSRYRTNGSADLVLQRETDLVDDYVFRINTYLPVAWRRHLTFARTANYLVVEDHLRASNEFKAYVNWMINPEAEVSVNGKSAFVSVEGKTLEIQFSSGQMGALELESVFDANGVMQAHRLRAPINGKTARVISVISDVVDADTHKVSRIGLGGNEYAFRVVDKRVDEQIIVTQSGAGITTSDIDVNDGVAQVAQAIASGNLSDEEVLQQRLNVHEAIRVNKAQVWNSLGSLESREKAIQRLKEVARSENVTGVRDHGLAAALIDLAGVDLKNMINDVGIVHNYNRTAIVDWAGENELQEYYQVPIYTSRDTSNTPEFSESKQIWSVDLGELVLSSYNAEASGDTLVVYFHGATDRTRHATPRYERLRSFATIGQGPLMFFADPTLDFDARMILSWFIGNEATNIHREMAQMISAYAQKQKVKHVVLVGNSGGGFTALQVSSFLDGVEVLSVNGQVDLGNYQTRIVDPAYRAVYGVSADSETVSSDPRFNIIKRLQDRGFNNRVMMYQNTGDDHHMKDHYQLFEDAFGDVNAQDNLFNVEKVFLGDGHVAPSAESYIKVIQGVIEEAHATGAEFKGTSRY